MPYKPGDVFKVISDSAPFAGSHGVVVAINEWDTYPIEATVERGRDKFPCSYREFEIEPLAGEPVAPASEAVGA